MDNFDDLNGEIAAMATKLAKASESVWHWHESEDRTIDVSLIEADKREQAHRMKIIGLAGGEGRCLHFVKTAEHWTFAGESHWIG
jgi:hypothetical protein